MYYRYNEKLVMVTKAGFAPYEFYENNEIVGVDIEIAKEIAKSMNKKLEVKDIAFDSIINELNAGKTDWYEYYSRKIKKCRFLN